MKHQGLDELRSVLRQAKMKYGWPTVASIVRDVLPEAFVDFGEDQPLVRLPDDWREGLTEALRHCGGKIVTVAPEEYQQELTALSKWLINNHDVRGVDRELLDLIFDLYTHWTGDEEIGSGDGPRDRFVTVTCKLLDLGDPPSWDAIRSRKRRVVEKTKKRPPS
jgi:hypothetical protein